MKLEGKKTICVLGNAAIERKIFLKSFPPKNWEATIDKEYVNVGGSGAHSAAALSILGFKVYMIAQVGTHADGRKILSELEKTNVDTYYVLRSDLTSTNFISAFDKNQKRIMFIRPIKQNDEALFSNLSRSLELADILVICPTTPNLVMRAARLANSLKKLVIISPQAAFFDQSPKWIEEFLGFADMIFLNETEICKYAHLNNLGEATERVRFNNWQIVVVTRGINGCMVISDNGVLQRPAKRARYGTVVDPSGAGDSFMAGFIWSLKKSRNLVDAADTGAIAGLATSLRTELSEKCFSLKEHLEMRT